MRESESGPGPRGSKVPTILVAGVICLTLLSACSQEPEQSRSTGPGILDEASLPVPEIAEADALRDLGRHLEAAQLYQRIAQAEPENAAARFGLAESLYELGEFDSALQAYQTVEQEPEFAARAFQGRPWPIPCSGAPGTGLGGSTTSPENIRRRKGPMSGRWRSSRVRRCRSTTLECP